ncbi:MAG: DNA mismatch repair protein MutS [Deltaproteobacteria bacterium]|nr:DNA mismatch repair protein MutS [Deltaproteobacteria bacterium]
MNLSHTPMIEQYLRLKKQYQDCILFFRLGDFYEMFFEDARAASKILNLTLTSRYKKTDHEVPMCGVPHHAAGSYIKKLTHKGYRVAICEQTEEPQPGKNIVDRDVVQIVTPALPFNEDDLLGEENYYLMAVCPTSPVIASETKQSHRGSDEITTPSVIPETRSVIRDPGIQNSELLDSRFRGNDNKIFNVAYMSIVTGEFYTFSCASQEELISELTRIDPKEVLVEESFKNAEWVQSLKRENFYIYFIASARHCEESKTTRQSHRGSDEITTPYGLVMTPCYSAQDILFEYLKLTKHYKTTLSPDSNLHQNMVLDGKTLKNLDVVHPWGEEKQSLFKTLNFTKSACGGRLLKKWLKFPLLKRNLIEERLHIVKKLFDVQYLRESLQKKLNNVYDLERICSKLERNRAHPKDLKQLLVTLEVAVGLQADAAPLSLRTNVKQSPRINSLVEDPPLSFYEGGVFKKGYSKELDELIDLTHNYKTWVLRYEEEEKSKTGISSLKVKYNSIFGYYIEVRKTNLDKVPETYHRKQTLVQAERYTTEELKDFESRILSAEVKRKKLETQLFEKLREDLKSSLYLFMKIGTALAELDVFCALSEAANRYHYVMPHIVEDQSLKLFQSRHPVVEQGHDFIPNDIVIEKGHLHLITGPNMGGKSTVMRQVALSLLMMQMGSFVPAEKAFLPIVDRIFTRIGASDDIAQGESTFMVEMKETSHILASATHQSFIILDEVGRGTSTFDGLSLAWSIAEWIVEEIRCLTLFATHYHELTVLSQKYENIKNEHMAALKKGNEIVFQRKLKPGALSASFGIEVGRLAGLPVQLLERAQEVLKGLTLQSRESKPSSLKPSPSTQKLLF